MDNIKSIGNKRIVEIKKRGQENKGLEYRFLYLRLSYALVVDEHIRKIGARTFGVFIVIRRFMDKDSIAYPSLNTIAYLSNLSPKTIQDEVKRLIKFGWIEKIGRLEQKKGRFGNTRYRILEQDLIRGSKQRDFIEQPLVMRADGE